MYLRACPGIGTRACILIFLYRQRTWGRSDMLSFPEEYPKDKKSYKYYPEPGIYKKVPLSKSIVKLSFVKKPFMNSMIFKLYR